MTIKLADFGTAKQLTSSEHTITTTLPWAAPEQSSRIYDEMVGIWAVGCVVYFLLTSLKPFEGGDGGDDTAAIDRYTYPFWPRLSKNDFQQSNGGRKLGDQILVRGVSNTCNNFLDSLIVADPRERISAHKALQHWTPNAIPHCGLPYLEWLCSSPFTQTYPGDLVSHLGDREMVVWLLVKTRGTSVESASVAAAFLGASERGRVEIVELLCNQYVSVDVMEAWVVGAATGGHIEVLELLFSKNPNPAKQTLMFALSAAVRSNHFGTVLQLLCAGARADNSQGGMLLTDCDGAIADLLRNFGSSQLSAVGTSRRGTWFVHRFIPSSSGL